MKIQPEVRLQGKGQVENVDLGDGAMVVDLDKLPKLSHHLVDDAMCSLMRSLGYLSDAEFQDVVQACQFGDKAHIKDKRKSGEPYITHPIAVAEILAGFHLDRDTIIAAILHDTVEDTEVTFDDVSQLFGNTVARLVDGVTKLKSSSHDKRQNKAATFHKIVTATLDDPRVLIIKLADRLHNMSTLDAVKPEKQKATAQETLDFYVPFARLMGLNDIANYIEVLCYRNLDPEMYRKLHDKLLQQGLGRNFHKEEILHYLWHLLDRLSLSGRVRALDNQVMMYRQFFRNRGDYSSLLRQYAFEVVLDTVEACDDLADYLITKYGISLDNIEDHIRYPLAGGNQSLTLTYQRADDVIKVTILTRRMQKTARLGVLAVDHVSDVSKSVIQASLRNIKEWATKNSFDKQTPDYAEVVQPIEQLMSYFHERKILCYSPKGQAYELPRGATALDFAYAVGPFVGNVATGANVNYQPAKLGTLLKDGDVVEVEVDNSATPKAEWLGFVATNKARELILHWFKDLSIEDKQHHGEQALDRALKTYDKCLGDLTDSDWQDLLEWRGLSSKNELFEQISSGRLFPQLAVLRIFSDEVALKSNNSPEPRNLIANAMGVELDFAGCCSPIYGDPIVGNLSRHGLVVHRHKCYVVEDISKTNPYQVIPLKWRANVITDTHDPEKQGSNHDNHIRFTAYLQVPMLLDEEQVSKIIYVLRELGVGVSKFKEQQGRMTIVHVVVRSRSHISQAIRAIRKQLGYPSIIRRYHE